MPRGLGSNGKSAAPQGSILKGETRFGLGLRLKQLRQQRGLALQDVARQTGLSRSFLSLVENDRSDIALSRLLRITELYGVAPGDLFGEMEQGPVHVTRSADARLLRTSERGATIHILSTNARRKLEPYRIRLARGARLTGLRHAGDEFAIVLEGRIRLLVSQRGEQLADVILEKEDAVYFGGELTHTYENVSPGEAVIMGTIDEV